VRKDGVEIPVEIGLNPIETNEGIVVLASVVDITARRRAEARFRVAVECWHGSGNWPTLVQVRLSSAGALYSVLSG